MKLSGLWQPSFASGSGLTAFSTPREITSEKRQAFLESMGISLSTLHLPKQVHEAAILFCEQKKIVNDQSLADGLITNVPGTALGIQTADCLPVFFWNPVDRVMGLAHAGWRGLQAGILSKMIRCFRDDFKSCACDIRVAIGPSIRSCCYEVGEEFAGIFSENYHPGPAVGKGFMDLSTEAKAQLINEGLEENHLEDSRICTACQNDRFFSFRKEKTPERILSVLSLSIKN